MRKSRNKNKKKVLTLKGRSENKITKVKSSDPVTASEVKKIMKDNPLSLRFSPTAWSKLLFMRDIGNTEIGGFGITLPDDPLYVSDFITVKQECTSVNVEFDDQGVSDFMLDMVEAGLQPENFFRIWIHTHPNISPTPSGTDENTFKRDFGSAYWAVMAILSKYERTYCRIQINNGPIKGNIEIPIVVDFSSYEFAGSNSKAWYEEYDKNITRMKWISRFSQYSNDYTPHGWTEEDIENYMEGYHYQSSFGDVENNNSYTGDGVDVPEELREEVDSDSIPNDDAYDYSAGASGDRKYHKDTLVIPQEVEEFIDANTMILLDHMTPYERDYIFDEIRNKHNIGD